MQLVVIVRRRGRRGERGGEGEVRGEGKERCERRGRRGEGRGGDKKSTTHKLVEQLVVIVLTY